VVPISHGSLPSVGKPKVDQECLLLRGGIARFGYRIDYGR
jgi:hypothetical protein